MNKKKLTLEDKKLRDWLKQGGSDNSKKDFQELLKKASTPQKPSKP